MNKIGFTGVYIRRPGSYFDEKERHSADVNLVLTGKDVIPGITNEDGECNIGFKSNDVFAYAPKEEEPFSFCTLNGGSNIKDKNILNRIIKLLGPLAYGDNISLHFNDYDKEQTQGAISLLMDKVRDKIHSKEE